MSACVPWKKIFRISDGAGRRGENRHRRGRTCAAHVADRLIDRESPLRVWRDYRGLSQSALARACGVNRVQFVEIESGCNSGSVHTLRKLADALRVAVDDIIPA